MAMADTEKPFSAIGQPCEVFHHSPEYHILICKPCGFAVQPGAISRHFKDIHHLYRQRKTPYVEYASRYTLKEPGEVEYPPPGQLPVPYLPVEKGWACKAQGCEHLCVSTKRMQAHWSSYHGRKGVQDCDYSPCHLQTLFRGKHLRYFQVSNRARAAIAEDALQPEGATTQISSRANTCRELEARHSLDPSDAAALRHYFNRTHRSFVTSKLSEDIWLDVVPWVAQENEFLLRGMLACSYLEMAYLRPDRRELYTLKACAHHEIALPLFHDAVAHATDSNCDAIIVFSYFLLVYSLATDENSSNHSLLIVSDDENDINAGLNQQLAIPQWLYFIRVGCSMLTHLRERIEEGPVFKLALAWGSAMEAVEGPILYLEHFLKVIPNDSSWTDDNIATYRQAAETLARSLTHTERIATRSDLSTWSVLSIWPVCVGDDYYNMLYERHPGALILLAHYSIILKQIQSKWFFDQGAMRLLMSIRELLEVKWHPYIEHPMRLVLG